MPPVRMTYEQIANDLATRIRAGEYAATDGQLPSYKALAEIYSCSISTIQRAIGLLKRDRLVIGHQGIGIWAVTDQTDE